MQTKRERVEAVEGQEDNPGRGSGGPRLRTGHWAVAQWPSLIFSPASTGARPGMTCSPLRWTPVPAATDRSNTALQRSTPQSSSYEVASRGSQQAVRGQPATAASALQSRRIHFCYRRRRRAWYAEATWPVTVRSRSPVSLLDLRIGYGYNRPNSAFTLPVLAGAPVDLGLSRDARSGREGERQQRFSVAIMGQARDRCCMVSPVAADPFFKLRPNCPPGVEQIFHRQRRPRLPGTAISLH